MLASWVCWKSRPHPATTSVAVTNACGKWLDFRRSKIGSTLEGTIATRMFNSRHSKEIEIAHFVYLEDVILLKKQDIRSVFASGLDV